METQSIQKDEFEQLYYFKNNLIFNYNRLIGQGESEEIFDINLKNFIDHMYKKKIADICGISEEEITSEMLDRFEEPHEESERFNDHVITFKIPYNSRDLIRIIKDEYNKKVTNDNMLDEPTDCFTSTDSKCSLLEVDKEIRAMYEKYKDELNSEQNVLDRIELLKNSLYKKVVSEVCGIKPEEIKTSVINYLMIGVLTVRKNENNEEYIERRPYTDRELKLYVPFLNSLEENQLKEINSKKNIRV